MYLCSEIHTKDFMEKMKYDVFISYRRDGGAQYARTIQQALERRKYHVFLDFDELDDGVFDQRIIDAISSSSVFLLILSKSALDRCVNEKDWVRLEILQAVKCGCHMVPVNIDGEFGCVPETLPEELRRALSHQFSELQMQTLFKASMEQLVRNRIAPYVKREDEKKGAEIHIEVDADCDLFRFSTFVRQLKAGEDNVIYLQPGTYKLNFVSTEIPEVKIQQKFDLMPNKECDCIDIAIKEPVEKERQRREAEEAKRKAKEEAKRKAEEEAKRKAEEKAKRKAEEEARRKAEEEARENCNTGLKYFREGSYKKALEFYLKAANQGNVSAQNNLAMMYSNGIGVKPSDEEAVKWFCKAAMQGGPSEQYKIGVNYFRGSDCFPQSYEEAAKWFLKAAEQGDAVAQFQIGWMYKEGKGVKKDLSEAQEWFSKATIQGWVAYSKAQKALDRLAGNG